MPTVNTNVAAIKARLSLDKVQRELDTSIARLSSGKRITRAHDDAAGSAIAGRMESQIRGLTMNIKNAKDGQSLVDTQEGAMQQISALLQRMRELAVQASSGTVNQNTSDKDSLQVESRALMHEILAIGLNTKFNDKKVFDGTAFSFYTDIDASGTAITTVTAAIYTSTLNIATATISIGGTEAVTEIKKTISIIDTAIAKIDGKRASLGALSNRFDHVIDNLTNVVANTESALSRVQDADYAVETTQLTRNTILQQAATSMVAQANAGKNMLLALIQG
jgi:flagellin